MPQEAQAQLSIYLDGQRLKQATAYTLNSDGGKIPVYTLDGGLAGFTKGSGQTMCTIEYALPAKGQEFPFQQLVNRDVTVNLQFVAGAEHYVGEGQLMTDEKSQSVNSSTTGTVNWTGEAAEMQ